MTWLTFSWQNWLCLHDRMDGVIVTIWLSYRDKIDGVILTRLIVSSWQIDCAIVTIWLSYRDKIDCIIVANWLYHRDKIDCHLAKIDCVILTNLAVIVTKLIMSFWQNWPSCLPDKIYNTLYLLRLKESWWQNDCAIVIKLTAVSSWQNRLIFMTKFTILTVSLW